MANQFAHIELTTSDLGKAKKFYKKLFDWKLTDMPMDHGAVYTMIAPGKGAGGGMQAKPMPEAPVTWLPYVEVDSVPRSLAKAGSPFLPMTAACRPHISASATDNGKPSRSPSTRRDKSQEREWRSSGKRNLQEKTKQ